MSRDLRPVGLNRSIDDELQAIDTSIALHQRALHEEGVWLFLAVLGCWSVYPEWLRLCALFLAVFLFGHRYDSYRTDRRSFPHQFVAARARLTALVTDSESRAEGLERLAELERERLGGLQPLYRVPGFVVGWFSFGATVLATAFTMWSHRSAA